MYVAGVDGCRAGWVAFRIDLASRATAVEFIDLPAVLKNRPEDLRAMAIDIPIGLLDRSRRCDLAARALLGHPRWCSVFSPPCRAALQADTYEQACAANHRHTGRKISRQAWEIASKIRAVDDAISCADQEWAFEVHPEVCFWAMNGRRPMAHSKKTAAGHEER
jgi:predicted RNase H-like nuclease